MDRKNSAGGIGVLLVNLGTPDATDFWSIRRYLKEFLSDRRVIETNRLLWWFVLNFVVLPIRSARKGRDYDKIWNRERNESPLKTITRAQAEKLALHFAADRRITVDWCMRYGNPSIPSRLAVLDKKGCARILIVPLYPQYAAATTASVGDKVFETLAKLRRQPTLRFVPPYFDDPAYIEAVASSIEEELAKLSWKPEVVLASFHGIPREYVRKGDPYESQCFETVRLLRERLKLDEGKFRLTFQSRFGRAEWLTPYTDETVRALARSGVKNIAVVTPGFSADCLETLEEIAVENAEIFRYAGGDRFAAIPCLNDSERGMRLISGLVERELSGWI
jgi:protoporphyrin/coproporphyrin ferrochelatase